MLDATPSRSAAPEPARSSVFDRIAAWVRQSAAGKDWRPRALLVPVLAWFFVKHLGDPDYAGIYDGLNLAIHEGGHLLFSWSGSELLTAAGGTLLELACPVLAGVMFVRQRDAFAVTVALFWLGTVFLDIAPYLADARAQALPLVTVGGGAATHDWTYLLGRFGWLERDVLLGGLARDLGLVTLAGGLAGAVWVLRVMARAADG